MSQPKIVIYDNMLSNADRETKEWKNRNLTEDELCTGLLEKDAENESGRGYADFGYIKLHFDSLEDWRNFYRDFSVQSEESSEKLLAVMALLSLDRIEDIEAIEGMEKFVFFKDAGNYKELGTYILKKDMGEGLFKQLERYIDIETYGRDYVHRGYGDWGFFGGNFVSIDFPEQEHSEYEYLICDYSDEEYEYEEELDR